MCSEILLDRPKNIDKINTIRVDYLPATQPPKTEPND